MASAKVFYISAGRILFFSFLFVILSGYFLLSLSAARHVEIAPLDLLFTATSATCVTGLYAVPISSFTTIGHCILLCLIQIGGLGLMTLSLFLVSLFSSFGLATTFIAGKILEFESLNKIKFFLGVVIGSTLITETIGAVILYPTFRASFEPSKALFYAVFHSVSAFCNAGIALFDTNLESFQEAFSVLGTLGFLTFAGGIGFIVWYEVFERIRSCIKNYGKPHRLYVLSLHSKIVLWASLILILGGGAFFAALEWSNSLAELAWPSKIMNALFLSVSARSTGFSTIDLATASLPSILILTILMFIGASPSSTGSGIKTTTIVLIFATVISIIRGRSDVELGGRALPTDQIYKAISIIFLGIVWIAGTTFMLLLTEEGFSFLDIFFESLSAFATTGLTRGITANISSIGKTILMASMIIGRIGSLTLVLAMRRAKEKQLYRYPEERVLIG